MELGNWAELVANGSREILSEDCAGLLTSKSCKPQRFLCCISLCDRCGLGCVFSACAVRLVVTKKPLISILCQPSFRAGREEGAVALCKHFKSCGMTCAVHVIHAAFGNTLSCSNEQNEQWRATEGEF